MENNNKTELEKIIKQLFKLYGKECDPMFLKIWGDHFKSVNINYVKEAFKRAIRNNPNYMPGADKISQYIMEIKEARWEEKKQQENKFKEYESKKPLSDEMKKKCILGYLKGRRVNKPEATLKEAIQEVSELWPKPIGDTTSLFKDIM